jgi:hypothetical protein
VDGGAIQELRPALKTAEFFETYFDVAERGQLDQHGKSSLLRSAVLGPESPRRSGSSGRRGRSNARLTHSWRRS